jgi:hypothetical protein
MNVYRQKGLSGPAQMDALRACGLLCQPSNFLPSVVHMKMHSNDIIACLYKFTDCRVEKVTREE